MFKLKGLKKTQNFKFFPISSACHLKALKSHRTVNTCPLPLQMEVKSSKHTQYLNSGRNAKLIIFRSRIVHVYFVI